MLRMIVKFCFRVGPARCAYGGANNGSIDEIKTCEKVA